MQPSHTRKYHLHRLQFFSAVFSTAASLVCVPIVHRRKWNDILHIVHTEYKSRDTILGGQPGEPSVHFDLLSSGSLVVPSGYLVVP